jgi:hypothetical protein
MGLLSKKEPKEVVKERPFQLVGKDNGLKWYSDNNDILVNSTILKAFLDDYFQKRLDKPIDGSGNGSETYYNDIIDTFIDEEYIYISNVIYALDWINLPNLLEYLLVYLELPEMVENMVIDRIYQFKREKGRLMDKINEKRKKIVQFNPLKQI